MQNSQGKYDSKLSLMKFKIIAGYCCVFLWMQRDGQAKPSM